MRDFNFAWMGGCGFVVEAYKQLKHFCRCKAIG
jgi:hypothetical protein